MATDTLLSIARKCDCSVTTVSRVLSGKAQKYRISESMVQKVLQAARESNFAPNLLAKSLRLGKTDTIGLLIPGVDDTFFAGITSVIISEARKNGYNIVTVDTQESEAYEAEGLSTLIARNVDGIIAVPVGKDSGIFKNLKVPVVMVDRYYPDCTDIDVVKTDDHMGAVMAVDHLYEMGHRNICCIQGNPEAVTSRARVQGYVEAMKRHGLDKFIRVEGQEFSIVNGYDSTKKILSSSGNVPTALFPLSNKILLGTIKAIREKGLSIPDDISLIAFDDNVLFNYLSPRITCISQPVQDMAATAVQSIINKISGGEETLMRLLPPDIVVRDSVRKI